jgi:VanZ family protein
LLVLWSLFIAYGTLLPFDFRADLAAALAKLRGLREGPGRPTSTSDVVSNVLLFVPWGLLYASRAEGRGRGPVRATVGAACGGLALSGAVELAQLFLPSRTTSLIDLVNDTAGSVLGAAAGWPMARRARDAWRPRIVQLLGRRPMLACAAAMGAGLVLTGLSPFDVSLDMGSLRASLKAARPIPFGPNIGGTLTPPEPWSWAREALTWAVAGGLAMLAAFEAGSRGPRAAAGVVGLCGGLALLIEVAQLAIPGRVSDASSVIIAIAGAAAGAAVVGSAPRWAARRWIGPALACWSAVILLSSWTPPHLALSGRWPPDWSQLVPFWSYYRRTDIYALADLIDQVLAFVPLGALLAARDACHAVRRALWVGFAFGAILEAGQLLLADRTAEITDALAASAGAALGARLWLLGTAARPPSGGHARYRVRP